MDQAIPRGPGGPSGSAPRKKKKKFSILGFIGKIFLVLFTLCVIGVLTLGMFAKLFMTYINTNLIPSLGEITIEEMTMSLASTIYATDKNGNQVVLQTLFDNTEESGGGNRELIEYKDLPDHLIKALVAIEDHRFWEHKGVDWYGTARAMLSSATGGNTQGGSTITQQLVRNMTGDTEVTVKRKFREICRALDFTPKTPRRTSSPSTSTTSISAMASPASRPPPRATSARTSPSWTWPRAPASWASPTIPPSMTPSGTRSSSRTTAP